MSSLPTLQILLTVASARSWAKSDQISSKGQRRARDELASREILMIVARSEI
jgi:hypothetical protein